MRRTLSFLQLLTFSGWAIAGVLTFLWLYPDVASQPTLQNRLMSATLWLGLVIGFCILLALDDQRRKRSTVRRIRQKLNKQTDMPESEAAKAHPQATLLIVRQAIADLFDVRVSKVHADHRLIADLSLDELSFELQPHIVNAIISQYPDVPTPPDFSGQPETLLPWYGSLHELNTVVDLAIAVENSLPSDRS